MKRIVSICFLICFITLQGVAQTKLLDEVIFGNTSSEKKHQLLAVSSQTVKGGLNEPARLLMPIEGEPVEGGNVTFKMAVDPDKQNYFTVRFWGGDSGNSNILILFCEGKQIGYRHLGDYDMLDIANEDAPFPGRFTYTTLPLPLHQTKGKKEIELSIRSTGSIFRYGGTFESYQKPMVKPTKAIYKGFTHTGGYFVPAKNEKQGKKAKNTLLRTGPGEEVLDLIKNHVNNELEKILAKQSPSQDELWVLSTAYNTKWTKVYRNEAVVRKVIEGVDRFFERYNVNPKSAIQDSWVTTGPLCLALYRFIPAVNNVLDELMVNGKTRRENWSEMFVTCVDYAKTHRRQYTNQSMIVDMHLYAVNRMLSIIAPEKALPAYQTLKYLYESMGIVPWLGSETPNGPAKPLSDDYYQLTEKGLTKELGFVGGYGEIMNWMTHIYEMSGEKGLSDSRDPLIRAQLLKMFKARSYFRYPALDNQGFKAMRAEAVVGWRDHGSYPGAILYGEKSNSRESTPLMSTISTLDPDAIAFAQQMIDDNQFFAMVKEKMKDRTIQSTQMLLRVPDEYETIKKQPRINKKLPMSEGMPDVLFSDEGIGVLALKNGEEILYASLYWRANHAVNFLARVHYMTPEIERIATVFEDIKFTNSGYTYKRPARINFAFSDRANYYPGIESAHTGEELPIAKVPDGVSYNPGQENVYAGKGDYYTLHYGKYLIAMNCTKDVTFKLEVPKAKQVLEFPSKRQVKESILSVTPMTTIVLIVE